MQRIKKWILTVVVFLWVGWAAWAVYDRYRSYLLNAQIVESFLLISCLLLFGLLFCAILIWKPEWLEPLYRLKQKLVWLIWPIVIAINCLPVIIYTFTKWNEPYGAIAIRAVLFGFPILFSAWLIEREKSFHFRSLISACLTATVLFTLITTFSDVNNYPFANFWSEGNRFWDYSVLFGRNIYNYDGVGKIPAYIDLGRQSLWGAVFLLPNPTIGMMRFWSDFLFTLPYALLGWVCLRKEPSKWVLFAFGLWCMAFLVQGPIYTPLVLAAVLVAIGRKCPLWIAAVLTAASGYYANMSRLTWLVAPAAFAALLAFCEISQISHRTTFSRWLRTIILGLSGLFGALFGGRMIAILTGAFSVFASSDTAEAVVFLSPEWFSSLLSRQPLIWNRLWPNATYAPGIVLGLILAVAPVTFLLLIWHFQNRKIFDIWQKLLMTAVCGVFLVIGLIVSVKIGGGSNLHNLDMFLIAFLLVVVLCWEAGFGAWLKAKTAADHWVCTIVVVAILIPTAPGMMTVNRHIYPPSDETNVALTEIRTLVMDNQDKEILFLDQRQLLTFGFVPQVKLIAEYEKKRMMDEAMADHAPYFEPYIADLKANRFALIISEPLHIKIQGSGYNFSEENDLFVKWVSIPTICYYEPLVTFAAQGVQVLVPRAERLQQEGVICP